MNSEAQESRDDLKHELQCRFKHEMRKWFQHAFEKRGKAAASSHSRVIRGISSQSSALILQFAELESQSAFSRMLRSGSVARLRRTLAD
jgi:hypothetical protein